jgi:hypothetical protein
MRPGRHAADDGSFQRSAGVAAGRGALLLLVAVVLGIILLNKTDNTTATTVKQTNTTVKHKGSATTTTFLPTTTSVPTHDPATIKVLPVNGTPSAGIGSRAKEVLLTARYNALAPTDAKNKPVKVTVLFAAPGYEGDARAIGVLLGIANPNVQPMPADRATIATNTANANGANIILVVGEDIAATLPAPSTTTTTAKSTTTTAKKATTTSTTAHGATTSTTKKP